MAYFMARRVISMIAFHGVESINIYNDYEVHIQYIQLFKEVFQKYHRG